MFVITADQVDSRNRADVVAETQASLQTRFGSALVLPVDRNAGDEVQLVTDDARTALDIVLALDRTNDWSIGVGCGAVREPLPDSARAATGPAFFAARDAVQSAKKRQLRFAIRSGAESEREPASDLEALTDLLLTVRGRRSAAGWELYDLLLTGITQREAAERLGISEPAVSSRARAAGIHPEASSTPAIARLMNDLDTRSVEGAPA
ncbi:DNA-binding protein [Humibacter ginsenosidimutans]|uniref:DNA-binding protein n=1 Tax=Humibacter ginsenosidimutans TaxID=2599293 RepID=A0A5B8LYF1_9MICO|nr:DNA-binding protein [Humibacter ginsenosidimutans]QDZ13548.1 DNA-binding protein [Humibacter ginsenosidimutans]